jgi:hypothetical protein
MSRLKFFNTYPEKKKKMKKETKKLHYISSNYLKNKQTLKLYLRIFILQLKNKHVLINADHYLIIMKVIYFIVFN